MLKSILEADNTDEFNIMTMVGKYYNQSDHNLTSLQLEFLDNINCQHQRTIPIIVLFNMTDST